MQRRFDEVDRRFNFVEADIRSLGTRLDTLQEAMFALHRMMFRASVAGILALIAILATQL